MKLRGTSLKALTSFVLVFSIVFSVNINANNLAIESPVSEFYPFTITHLTTDFSFSAPLLIDSDDDFLTYAFQEQVHLATHMSLRSI